MRSWIRWERLLALTVAGQRKRTQPSVQDLAKRAQEATGETAEIAFVDQGDTSDEPAAALCEQEIQRIVVKHDEPKRGFLLLLKTLGERTFGSRSRLRTLGDNAQRLALARLIDSFFLQKSAFKVNNRLQALCRSPIGAHFSQTTLSTARRNAARPWESSAMKDPVKK